jgi:signal transduction histidine kinase
LAKLKTDSNGRPLEMIGACLDNTENVRFANAVEQKSRQLQDIAWQQSHAVRSPLVTIMGLAELLRNSSPDKLEHEKMLEYLYKSAVELDKQVRLISTTAESDKSA